MKRFDCEDEPNEFMEAPCICCCGKWFDLDDGYRGHQNNLVCRECNEINTQIDELRERYRDLSCGDKPHKRERANILKELNKLGAELED